MNSILKFASVLAVTAILCVGAIAQTSDDAENKTCCKGKGDKATCCQSQKCQRDEEVAAKATTADEQSREIFTVSDFTPATDGLTISCGCCKAGGASTTAPIILALDIDKDGIVSATEIKNATQSLLALDLNQDGKLDRKEMHANTGFSKVNASTKISANKPKTYQQISGTDAEYFAKKLMKADANLNGILEPAEIKPSLNQIMHVIDLNDDGQLSLFELKRIPISVREYNQGDDDPGSGGGPGGNDDG